MSILCSISIDKASGASSVQFHFNILKPQGVENGRAHVCLNRVILGLMTASFVDAPMLFFFVSPLSPFSPVSVRFLTGVCQNHFLFTYKGVGTGHDSSSWELITLLTQFKLFGSNKEEEQQISQLMN